MMKGLALAALLGAGALHAQRTPVGALAGRIVDENGHPLSYGIVALVESGRERFTDDSGFFRFPDLPAGPTVVRVRRLGFAPAQLTVPIRAEVTDTIRVALRHVVITLAAVDIREYPPCHNPGPPDPAKDSTLAVVFEQLRMNSRQFQTLREKHPFATEMQLTIVRERRNGSRQEMRGEIRETSREHRPYEPGRVVMPARAKMRRFAPYEFNVPELGDFAREEFVRAHCFHRGPMVEGDSPLIRIDVRAAERLRYPDVEGSILLDAATFQIRRTALRMSRVPSGPEFDTMKSQDVVTEFREVLPSIPVIDRVYSVQRFDPRSYGVTYVAVHETQRLVKFEFLGSRPGEGKSP